MLRTLGGIIAVGGLLGLTAYIVYLSGEIVYLWLTLLASIVAIQFPWPYRNKYAFSDLGGIASVGGILGLTAYALYFSGDHIVLWLVVLVAIVAIQFPWSYKARQRKKPKKQKPVKDKS